MQVHQGSVAREDHPSLSLHAPASPPPTSCLPIVLWKSSHFDTTQLLTRGCRAHRMMSSSPKPPSPQARSREILVSPAKSAFLSSQLPPSHVPPQTWLEDGTARRTNETKALGDAPQVPISSHPRSRRVVTRHHLCNQSRLLTLHFDVRSGKWSLR